MENITHDVVRLINGSDNLVMSITEAQEMAAEKGMDLVMVDENSNPPVVKIMDEGKYKYELAKKQKRAAKQQRSTRQKIKEIQLRPVTGDNDISIKAKNANEFLSEGNIVKISVRFRGREHSHVDLGHEVVNKILSKMSGYKITHDTRGQGKDILVIVGPEND